MKRILTLLSVLWLLQASFLFAATKPNIINSGFFSQKLGTFIYNGKNIIFWENKWLRDRVPKYEWHFLYSLARKKKCSAETFFLNYADRQLDIFAVNNESLLAFHSSDELHEFIECMKSLQLQLGQDKVEWTLTANKLFTVKSCYNFFNDGGLRSRLSADIWQRISGRAAPYKIKIFVWLATHDKTLSRENLSKRGWPGPQGCAICGYGLESNSHIFL